jgi:Serine-threonine protein kinase 19
LERELSNLVQNGTVRRVLLSGSTLDGKAGQIRSAGGEYGLIISSTHRALVEKHVIQSTGFMKWLDSVGRSLVTVSHSDLNTRGVSEEEIYALVESGFLTIEYSLNESGYAISLPGTGDFVRNLRAGRRELLTILNRQRYKELLEKACLN